MINWNKITKEDQNICIKIINRAKNLIEIKDRIGAEMDIQAAHITCPLKLKELLAADNFNFMHDVCGISNNINRETGELENCFVPRFARKRK